MVGLLLTVGTPRTWLKLLHTKAIPQVEDKQIKWETDSVAVQGSEVKTALIPRGTTPKKNIKK
jgi:hypothetical protein